MHPPMDTQQSDHPPPWRPKRARVPPRTTTHRSTSTRLLLLCCMVTISLWHLPSPAGAQPDDSPYPYDPDKSRLAGQFLHITDIHPDEFYINGGSISTSCHRNTTDDDDNDMMQMMRPGRIDGGYGGLYGSPYSICDSPFSLANATFDWIDRNLIKTLDFVVWTGDNARHDSDNERPRTQKEIEDLNRVIANKFLETFTPDEDDPFEQRIPIVPSIGNNDVYPHNIMEAGPNRILQHFSEIWLPFIPESQYHTFQHGGYYASEVVPGKITVVALNTLYFFNQNAAVDGCDKEDEPGTDQMDWLEVELESLRRRKMTAYMTGHVPPARKSYSPTCYVRYTDIALRFQDVIVGHLFGHANIDHFFILSQATLRSDSIDTDAEAEEESERKIQGSSGSRSGQGSSRQMTLEVWNSDATNNNNNSNSRSITSLSTASSRTRQRLEQEAMSFDVADEDEHYAFHSLGLNSYLIELWEQYEDIPKKAKLSDFAIALVAPSVVPTYNPGLRVYTYQLAIEKPERPDQPHHTLQQNEDYLEEDGYETMREMDSKGKKKKPKKKKPRKRPANPPAAPPITFGFPLNYTQYFVNLTMANVEAILDPTKPIEYQVEYRSREDYGLKDLSVPEWLGLARRIVKSEELKSQYLAWMVVLTGTENDHS
ncbi:Endopolyphosphatase [Linnemannia schmuckeri]|uniref:Endopolyphosphatase n=1 Tax=Linnemannia schmuckeri TaxID=64567 RepID=A0A9P5VFE8_9FUNG|nr:Endopolyphosphatase [Linnemannia schmuckeri]